MMEIPEGNKVYPTVICPLCSMGVHIVEVENDDVYIQCMGIDDPVFAGKEHIDIRVLLSEAISWGWDI